MRTHAHDDDDDDDDDDDGHWNCYSDCDGNNDASEEYDNGVAHGGVGDRGRDGESSSEF